MAQRKITEPRQDTADWPDLTEQQQAFVMEYLANGGNATAAYKIAYNTDNMGPNSISVEACRTRAHPKIALAIAQGRKNGMGAAKLSHEAHMQELERLKAIAIETGNVGAAVQAEQLRGKAAGHYVERHADVTTHDPVETLREIAKDSPQLAADLAQRHGIPWTADEGATKH